MNYQENKIDFELVEEELVTECSQVRCSHRSVMLQQYIWGKQKMHLKNQGILICNVSGFFPFFLCTKSGI